MTLFIRLPSPHGTYGKPYEVNADHIISIIGEWHGRGTNINVVPTKNNDGGEYFIKNLPREQVLNAILMAEAYAAREQTGLMRLLSPTQKAATQSLSLQRFVLDLTQPEIQIVPVAGVIENDAIICGDWRIKIARPELVPPPIETASVPRQIADKPTP